MAVAVTAIVPTLGRSPLLLDCLRALRREGGAELEIVVVDQGESPVALPSGLASRVLRAGHPLGFAAANNLAFAASAGRWIATVNDDAVVEPGWLARLIALLQAHPEAAAAQGVNLMLDGEGRPGAVDGWALAWNRWWQAVQAGRGRQPPPAESASFEVFGVSATAALYRRDALARVAVDGAVFDPRLDTFYEDVDLAARLRQAGFSALCAPAARVRHAGSTTAQTFGSRRWALLYGNRYLLVAKLLGWSFWTRLPVLVLRDLLDLLGGIVRREGRTAGILAGWRRAATLLPEVARWGGPAIPLGLFRRFQ